ncbi:MAG TPA: tetratricopeptide repeat protein [Pirellulales bacterium]|jgi:tetratricopeptide (TPR) repeat protein|nr:tetratricopeptide repeat protein [Pirellulales bacterium]
MQILELAHQDAGQPAVGRGRVNTRRLWLALALGLTLVLPATQAWAQRRPTASDADIKRAFGLPADYKNKKAFDDLKAGLNSFVAGNYAAAIEKFDAAHKKDGTLAPGHVAVAGLYAAANRVDLARRELEEAAIDKPDSPDVYLALGDLGLREGRLTDAQLEYRAAEEAHKKLQIDPASTEAKSFNRRLYFGLTSIAEQRRKWDQAKAFSEMWLANTEAEKGKELTTETEKNQQAAALQHLAQAEYFLDQPEEAEKALVRAAKLNDDLLNPKTQMGLFATQQANIKAGGDRTNEDYLSLMKQAQKYMEEGIATSTGDEAKARAEGQYAQWLVQDNKIAEAEQHANKALQLDPKSDAYKRVVAILDLHRHNFKEAEKYFREMYEKSPSDMFASNNLALALVGLASGMKEGSTEQTDALRMAEELSTVNARANQKSAEALSTLGWVYLNQNRVNEASQLLGQVFQAAQQQQQGMSPDTAFYLAKALARNGQLSEAMKVLQQAISVTSPFMYREEAESWLSQLEGQGVKPNTTESTPSTQTGAKSDAGSGSSGGKAPSNPPARNPK